jgi:two-component system CheB/CheR fusion protein
VLSEWNIHKLRDLLHDVISENKSFKEFEMEHDFPSIGQKNLSLNARRVRRIGGDQLVILTMQDITSHREAENIIKQQEERFRNLTNNVPVMIWTTDSNKLCNFVNKTWLDFTGRTLEEALGKGWIENVAKEDVDNVLTDFNSNFSAEGAL